MANLRTKSEWLESIQASLTSVEYDYIQSRSISVVPEGLKKLNKDAYIPRKVSIGPRFKGSREDLLHMEEVKLSCMLSLLHRGADMAIESLKECSNAVWTLAEDVRASYLAKIEVENHELAAIILVDGCFLLELLISKGLDSQFPSRLRPPSPAAKVLKDEVVLSDLMLLENQIPIFVLHMLSQTLFPNEFESDLPRPYSPGEEQRIETEEQRIEWERKRYWEELSKRELRAKKINTLALSVLGYSPQCYDLELLDNLETPHILDLVHISVNKRTGESTNTPSQADGHVVVDIIVIDTTKTRNQQLKLKRCALRLLTAGVTMKAKLPEGKKDSTELSSLSCFSLVWNSLCRMLFWLCNIFLVNGKHFDADLSCEEVDLKGLDFYFKIEKGELEIQQLHITKTTKAKWCNVIAWEHHKKHKYVSASPKDQFRHHYADISNSDNDNTSTAVSGGKFTSAALIFNGLICSPDDVQLLKDKKIIVDHLKMSNQELMEFFRTIAFGVDHEVADSSSHYIQLVGDINNYSKAIFIKRMWKTVRTSFTYRQEWLLTFMNRNYNFVATVLSILAVVQTVYTLIPYYFPK